MLSFIRPIRSLLLALVLAAPGLAFQPIAQTMGVFLFTPRLTLTMVGDSWSDGGWPKQRRIRLREMGMVPRVAISSEDGLFYGHLGFDTKAICDALESNRRGGRLRGASTISQQTARNLFLWQNRSWVRKGLEAGYTVLLEVFVPKDRILELYLNIAETGPHRYGAEAGAWHWFGKPASQLTLDEAARLIALLPNPKQRRPDSRLAKDKGRWIRDHLAPMPGEPGMDQIRDRARENGLIPWCW